MPKRKAKTKEPPKVGDLVASIFLLPGNGTISHCRREGRIAAISDGSVVIGYPPTTMAKLEHGARHRVGVGELEDGRISDIAYWRWSGTAEVK